MSAPLLMISIAVLLQAGSNGFLSGRLDVQQSLLFSAFAFAIATALFSLIHHVGSLRKPTRRGSAPASAFRPMVAVNVLTAVTFLGFYLSLAYIPTALAVSVETATSPLVIGIVRLARGGRTSAREWGVSVVLMICSGVLALRLQHNEIVGLASWELVLGVVLALAAGAGAAGVAMVSNRLGRLAITPVAVTANRFHLTYVLAFALLAFEPPTLADVRMQLPVLLPVAVGAVVLPLYLFQVGLQRADPLKGMTLVTTMPGLTYLAQVAFGAAFDEWAFGLTIMITVVAMLNSRPSRAGRQRLPMRDTPVEGAKDAT